MKKGKILAAVLATTLSVAMLAGCGKNPSNSTSKQTAIDLTGVNGDNSTVSMSVLYNGQSTMMRFDSTYVPYVSLNGTNYGQKHWKPAWDELQSRLKFTINDITPEKASSVSNAFELLQANKFNGVNIISGPVSGIVDEGTKNGTFIDLTLYKDQLPNFFNFIENNEIVKKSITSSNGEIFYAPYFDGFDDIETMFICRVDWVEKLLDDDAKYGTINYDTFINLDTKYQGYYDSMNTKFTAMKTATTTQEVSVSYTSGNGIIAIQNALATKNGQTLTEALKSYIKTNYVDKGYISKPSELFCGQNACYNADELIALWRCVKANPSLLTGKAQAACTDKDGESVIIPFYPRAKTCDRANQVLQLAQLWGVRGYESRNGYFYFDENGNLADGRVSEDMMEALVFLNQLYEEGLICKDYITGLSSGTEEYRDTFNKQNLGFMTYDYNQTTTIYNETINDPQTPYRNLSPILFPVADWDNKATAVSGATGKYNVTTNDLYQYTESWRSVKSEGWAITAATASNPEVLKKSLEIFDYAYSTEGQILMTYGPDEWIEHDAQGNIVYIDYYGRQVPKISQAALAELKNPKLGKGNYTNYYRYYVGSTLPIGFVKEQGMEYQAADEKGLVGLQYIGNAVVKGVLKHATVTKNTENVQNSLVPTTFALNDLQTQSVNNNCATLGKKFSNTAAGGENVFHNYVVNGFNASGKTLTKEQLLDQINKDWNLELYLSIHQEAYEEMY